MRGLRPDAIYRRGSLNSLEIYIDGAAKGNPGPAGIGIVIYRDGAVIKQVSRFIGETTNNVAEYTALIYALQEALILKASEIKVKTDSELLYKQIKGEYKVRHVNLKPLFEQLRHLFMGFKHIDVSHISRENNREADRLATAAVKENIREKAGLIGSPCLKTREESPGSRG